MSVNGINPLSTARVAGAGTPAAKPATEKVAETFGKALESFSRSQQDSDALIQKLAAGENVDLHQVMIAVEQTDIKFRVALAMRDLLVETYHEVMRMAV